ncbi:ketoacyl-ACP synthase III [Sphingomonas sp. 2SG]|uniref:ketoacyl-ACP synthase III n=1 Tax=Sphingomonas sp. 2SG TaxID=2502201 RepID=UPI0010FA0179|nr:ketoacyl-ACP synthase III [Sphingomonas sp. 2SG]
MAPGRSISVTGSRIAGVVSCLPEHVVDNTSFRERFGDKANDIEKMTGVRERRWTDADTTTADLCQRAAETLLERLGWERDSVDALFFVTQTPDYRLPATACALQGRLGLNRQTLAFDVNLGCSGYPYGLWLAMTTAASGAARRVLLLVGDTITKTVDSEDRSTAMLFGDAGTATAIEANADGAAHFILGTDGTGEHQLIISEGAFRSAPVPADDIAGPKADALYMDGGAIFNFTLATVPPLVTATLDRDGGADGFDAFLFHQANAFMLKHLAKKSRLPADKVPMNIDRFGNTSSATIPLLMTTDLATRLRVGPVRLGMFGFGVGFSWGSVDITVGPLACVETIDYR